MRTLITTLLLLLFTSQAQAVTNTFDLDGRLTGVTGLMLSDGMTYDATVQYNIGFDDSTPSSNLADALLDEAAYAIAAANGPTQDSNEDTFVVFTTQTDTDPNGLRDVAGYIVVSMFSTNPMFVDDIDFSLRTPPANYIGLIAFSKTPTVVPEPITASLIPLAVAPLLLRRRREA